MFITRSEQPVIEGKFPKETILVGVVQKINK